MRPPATNRRSVRVGCSTDTESARVGPLQGPTRGAIKKTVAARTQSLDWGTLVALAEADRVRTRGARVDVTRQT